MVTVAKNKEAGERTSLASLLDRLVLIGPTETGRTPTKFSEGEAVAWVDCAVWLVGDDGTPTPVGDDGVRVWSELLGPALAASVGKYVAAKIVRPERAYLFADLTDDEIARCEKAEQIVLGAVASGVDVSEIF